jgi:hypothetical protein
MQPNYSSIGQIFSAPARYTVPLFQRPYVWSKDDQWQPLWDDLRALADRVLDPPSHKPVAGHFLGTVVLEQLKTNSIAMPQRQVIDGQQRLTTLQLLLKAAEHALTIAGAEAPEADAKGIERAAGQTSQLSRNRYAHEPTEEYKVWPTNDDRAAFVAVMDSEAETGVGDQSTRMADAYRFFREAILAWLQQGDVGKRALAFAAALNDHLRLIVLDLDDNDEPQAIFETLNAHGTPLLPADLMKNWLLWQAGKQELDSNRIYQDYWSEFDREHLYWRKEKGTGHAARPRIDTFLQNWLTVAMADVIAVKHLYDRFLAHANQRAATSSDGRLDVAALMAEIARYSGYYRLIDDPQGKRELDETLRRLNRLDFVVFRPALMTLLSRSGEATEDATQGAKALESFLLRRIVCEEQTRGYGTLALDLVRTIKEVPIGSPATPALVAALEGSTGGWPDDSRFKYKWCSNRFYGWYRRDRVSMMLQAIEERYQTDLGKSEPIRNFNYAKLQIEHVMPQSWAANWPLPEGVSAFDREVLVQNIGNLTFVSEKLNPSLSNSAWFVEGSPKCKSAQLAKHSDVRLTKRLLEQFPTSWTEDGIRARAEQLFEQARDIWPSAAALREAATS